jgi:hypothetical protein
MEMAVASSRRGERYLISPLPSDLMAHAFSGKSPFEKIKRFLDHNGIVWRSDFWGSM